MGDANTSKPLKIIVVGGSLGGLCTGVALKTLGHSITILERNPTPLLQTQGAGIVAGGDTLAFFAKYDRCERRLAVPSHARMYLDKTGAVVHREEMRQNMTSWDLAYYLLRANFDGLESDYCAVPPEVAGHGDAVHRYGHTVTGVREEGSGVEVEFQTADGDSGSMRADLLIAADGPSSTVRRLLQPDVKRTLTGYVAFRGTVPEAEASEAALEVFGERFTFFHCPGVQILAYLIPGVNGTVEPGSRLVNFVWYFNFDTESKEFKELMTDVDNVHHRITLPPGTMRPEIWELQKDFAKKNLPPQFAEIICKTKKPFVQAITDVISPRNSYMDGKVLLIGDALAGFRPHTVASTSQAAYDAMILADMIEGKISKEDFVRDTMKFARLLQRRGMEMGNRSQFGNEPLEAHINDRNIASTPREKEVYPEWTLVNV